MASTGLSHVELTVRDLARSLHFIVTFLACVLFRKARSGICQIANLMMASSSGRTGNFGLWCSIIVQSQPGRMGWGREPPSLSC